MTLSASGEHMRASAERILRARFQALLDRSKRRSLTVVERREIDGLGSALNELMELETPTSGVPAPTP